MLIGWIKRFFPGEMRQTLRSDRGFSLIELLITLAVFAIITGMIYSVFSGFLRHTTTERKVAKTELDLVNVSWPLIKELQSAGFGVPKAGTCMPAAPAIAGSEITFHSTATGDDADAGAWSYVFDSFCTTRLINKHVIVISGMDRGFLVSGDTDSNGILNPCISEYKGAIAYWSPLQNPGDLECYETKYSLRDYTSSDKPKTCAPEVKKLSRSSSRTTSLNYEPVLDCVRDLEYRFGCIDTASGNLTWKLDSDCAPFKLRLMKVGLIVQSSTKRDTQVQPQMSLFEDLGTAMTKTVSLSNDQRYYKWEKREILITLRNLE